MGSGAWEEKASPVDKSFETFMVVIIFYCANMTFCLCTEITPEYRDPSPGTCRK
jgi:hypothetical protein